MLDREGYVSLQIFDHHAHRFPSTARKLPYYRWRTNKTFLLYSLLQFFEYDLDISDFSRKFISISVNLWQSKRLLKHFLCPIIPFCHPHAHFSIKLPHSQWKDKPYLPPLFRVERQGSNSSMLRIFSHMDINHINKHGLKHSFVRLWYFRSW